MRIATIPNYAVTCILLTAITSFSVPLASMADVDLDDNQLSDVWELVYNVVGADAAEDLDFDGKSNAEESEAGTDPRDPDSFLKISSISRTTTGAEVKFATQNGKLYKIFAHDGTTTGEWTEVGTIQGDGQETTAVIEPLLIENINGIARHLFKISAEDKDSDLDEISDWSENKLASFDPDQKQSAVSGQDDLISLTDLLNSGGSGGGLPQISVTVTSPEVFENDGDGTPTSSKFRITRSGGGLAGLTIFYTIAGSADPDKEAAEPEDYNAADFTGFVQMALGGNEVELDLTPITDAIAEFPETLTLTLETHSDYEITGNPAADIAICDATDDSEEILFIGQMGPERGADTSATGIGTLYLSAKKDKARVFTSFSGLTTAQTASHIHHSTLAGDNISITNGPVVESIPLGQVVNHEWTLRRTGAYSPQQLIDALFRQNGEEPLYVNVHSMQYGGGEIWGFFEESTGTTEFVPPVDPPAITPLTGDDLTRDVHRFLTQTTFGPTYDEIIALRDDIINNHGGNRIAGFDAWINAQFALDQTKHRDYIFAADAQEWALNGNDPINNNNPQPFSNNRRNAWFTIATQAHDQLRQRIGMALSEIFIISAEEGTVNNRHYGTARYYDQLCDDADGNYRALIEYISKSPMMGKYLSHLKNQKAILSDGEVIVAPDENYAREIMQLFSIGLILRHPDGSIVLDENGLPIQTYDNEGITELARIFTGWSFSKRVGSKNDGYPTQNNSSFTYYGGPTYFQASWENPMKNFSAYHDRDAKTIFGSTIAANLNGEQDLDAALDILSNHQNVAPFMARLLIQRFVTSNPSAGYIYRVAKVWENNGSGQRGRIRAVIRAILLDHEARSLDIADAYNFGKQKEPMLRYTQLLRALNANSQIPVAELATSHGLAANQADNFPAGASQIRFYVTTNWFGQSPLRSPTVFNWFLPDYVVGGPMQQAGLVGPEFTITSETQVIQSANYQYIIPFGGSGQGARPLPNQSDSLLDNVRPDIEPLYQMVRDAKTAGLTEDETVTQLVDHFDILLTGGGLKYRYDGAATPNPRNSIITVSKYVYNPNSTNENTIREMVKDIIYLISTSPEYIIQK